MFYLLFFLGLIVRFLLIGVPGFKADVAFWKGWGLAMADKGIIWLANNTNYNYPPGFAYVLWLINKTYALFADPYNIDQYWLDNNYLYLLLIKLVTIIGDIGVVWVIIKIADHFKVQSSRFKVGHFLALFYFLNPVTVFDGVIWGQVDQYGLFLFLVGLYFLVKERPEWASMFFVVSFLMKWQNIIFIPLFYLFIFKKYGFGGLVRSLKLSVITFIIVILPFFLQRQMASLFRLFTINSDWFPWYSLNAFNFWWIASGLDGMKISDKNLFLGILNAKQVGLLWFSLFYFLAVWRVFLVKKERLLEEFILMLTLVMFIFFHLLTQSHERYLFTVLGLIPILYLVNRKYDFKSLLIFYLLISFGIFSNMYISAAMNYPDQVFWPVSADITRSVTLWLSVYQIGLFGYFIWRYVRLGRLGVLGGLWVWGMVVLIANRDYLLRRPISLTAIKPIHWQQDYLEPVTNMTVESARGVFFWNRLSNNYYFYQKGIGSHANSEIRYGLGGRFSRFQTDFGIDTEGSADAKAYFIIEGDGRELYKSKVQGRFDPPGRVDLSIKGVKILTLKIKTGKEDINGVHADWLEPILIR